MHRGASSLPRHFLLLLHLEGADDGSITPDLHALSRTGPMCCSVFPDCRDLAAGSTHKDKEMNRIFVKAEGQNARRGADILLEILASEGVEYIFGNPGTTELPLL